MPNSTDTAMGLKSSPIVLDNYTLYLVGKIDTYVTHMESAKVLAEQYR